MGLFDDVLTPATASKKPSGLFDDVLADVPAPAPPERSMLGKLGDLITAPVRGIQRAHLSDAITRGATSLVAGTGHTITDFLDQTVQQPLRDTLGKIGLMPDADPLGFKAAADSTLGVEREINADRAAASERIGGRPTLGQLIEHPADAIEQGVAHIGNIGGESLPMMAAAIATRNPELAASLIGGGTAAQEYTDLRTQGIDRLPAVGASALTGAIETAGESVGLPFVMGKGTKSSLLGAILAEGGQEVPTQLGQQAVEDAVTGHETPILEQLGSALDAFLVGGSLGAGGHGLSVTTDALSRERAPAAPAPVAEAAPSTAIDPAILAAGNAALGDIAAPAQPAVAAPTTGTPENTDDLDALIAAHLPPEALQAALSATPEQQAQALASLGELTGEPADPTAAFRRPEPAPAAATPTETGESPERARLPAQDFIAHAAATMRQQAQERAAQTAKPEDSDSAQSPVGQPAPAPTGGDLADVPRAQPVTSQEAAAPAAPSGPTMFTSGKNVQAVRLADGSYKVRKRLAGQWQPWEAAGPKFEPTPGLFRPFVPQLGHVTIDGKKIKVGDRQPPLPKREKHIPHLLDVIASRGLNREAFRAQGVDPAQMTMRSGINPVFRKEGGMTLDGLREMMQQDGYLPRDPENAPPVVDDNDALDVLMRALGGEAIHADDQADAVAQRDMDRRREQEEWEADLADQHPDIADEDYDAAAQVARIAERARAVGVDEFDIAPFSDETDTDYIARLEREITQQEARRGSDNGSNEADRGERVRGQAESPDFALAAEQPAAEAPRQVAQSGLFAPPTAREFVNAAQQQKDASRNGLGRDVVRPESGDGELLAGAKPKQDVLESVEDVTSTPAFRRWSKGAKVLGPDEIPRGDGPFIVRGFHQTSVENAQGIYREGFDISRVGARGGDEQVPDGIFFKPFDNDIGVGATDASQTEQIPAFIRMERPFIARDRAELESYANMDPDYYEASRRARRIDKEIADAYDAEDARYKALPKDTTETYDEHLDAGGKILDEGEIRYKAAAAEARAAMTAWLKREGFDSVVIREDAGSFNRKTVTLVAFEPTQVKSSTRNNGEFDPANPSILADATELTDAELTDSERAAFDRQRVDRSPLRAKLSQQNGTRDADANGLREAVQKAIGGSAVQVEYLRGQDGLPERTRRTLADQNRDRGSTLRTSGLFVPGAPPRVFLFTDVVTTPELAAFTGAHEIAGHYGLRSMLGESLDNALTIAEQNPTVSAVADSMMRRRKMKPGQRMLAIEEALADLAGATRTGNYAMIEDRHGVTVPQAQRNTLRGAITRFLQRLKALFAKRGITFTDEQVHDLLADAWQAAQGEQSAEAQAPLESTEGLAPAEVRANKAAFTRNSRVKGVVYHATAADFDAFDPSLSDLGSHFGSKEQANHIAEHRLGGQPASVMPVYLNITNPLRLKDVGSFHADAIADQLARKGIITKADAKRIIAEDWRGRKANDPFVRDAIKAAGYDGVVYKNTQERYEDNWIVLDAAQVKSATANNGNFDASKPSILESVEDSRTLAEIRREEAAQSLPVARGAAGWDYDAGKWVGRAGQRNNARAHLQDKMLAWRDVQGQIESQLQQAIPDAQNVYRLENLMHGRVSDAIEQIERDQVKPLMEAMRHAGVKPDTLEEYLYARHATERNAQIAKINPAMPDGGSGMSNAEAAKVLAGADKAALEPLARKVDAITKATRKRLLVSGLITQQAFDAMDAQYQHYVPLRGQQVDEHADFGGGGMAGRGLDSRGKPVRQALGRASKAQHILGEVIGDAERSVILAEKARVGRAVMRLVLANPNPSLWQVEPVQIERAVDASGEVYEKVVNDWSDPSVVAVRHKGQLYRVQINSVPLAQALNNIGIDQLGAVTRIAGMVNRYFSAILTKYNPAFTPVNATRDALFGLTGMAAEHGELAALDAALHYLPAAKAAFDEARGKPGTGEWADWAREFAEHGGKTGYVNLPSAEDIARKIGTGKLTGYSPDGLRKVARVIGDAVGAINDAVENALRLSAYVTLRKRGSSADAAAAYAKDLTVNFNRKGFDGSKLNAWFLFYNASMQGGHRVSKLLRKPKTYAYLGMLAGAQVVATLAAMAMHDDNDEPLWNKVPDHVKRRNLVIVLPDGGLVTIPMPYGFNLFPYMAGRITESIANRKRGDDRAGDHAAQLAADAISAATQSFSPVPLDTGPIGLVPNILRIPLNVWANRNDFGGKIRDEDPYAKSDVPRASMGKPDTLEVFKLTAKGLNRIGGGDDLTPPPLSMFDVAPEDIEYLLKELTGGPGQLVTEIATAGQKATGGDFAQDLDARDIPITKRFRSNIDEQAAQQSLFYDRREVVDRSLKRVRMAFKTEGAAAAEKLLAATPELKGAGFKRRKGKGHNGEAPGSIILNDGSPQIVAVDENAVFGRYKAAEKAITKRNDNVETAFNVAPASLLPTDASRQRDASIRTENRVRMAAQNDFNAAWVRDVVGSVE